MPAEIIMPKVDMVMETGTFQEWLKNEGDLVQKGEPLFVIETDKAAIQVEAPASGKLAGISAHPDDVIPVTAVIGYILREGETLTPSAPAQKPQDQIPPESPAQIAPLVEPVGIESAVSAKRVRATPLARKVARENGIDLSLVQGRGPRGRIYQQDIIQSVELKKSAVEPDQPVQVRAAGADLEVPLPNAMLRERIPLKGPRAIIARRMSYSWSAIPHIYESVTVNANELFRIREMCGSAVQEETGHKLTYTAILAYITAHVLPRHPYLNSSLAGEEILLWEDVNLGLATDLDDYLIVPVVKQAQSLSLAGTVREIGTLIQAARSHKLGPDGMRNGTFTISNLGMFGIESFTAIINPPEAAILGVGKITESRSLGEKKKVRRSMNLVLGADHRIVDGAKAARFLNDLKAAIENPYVFL